MPQLLVPPAIDTANPALCCYVNATSQIQVVRIANISNWYFERVVFPGQKLLFEAPLTAQLEVHTSAFASAILADVILCERLQIQPIVDR